MTCVVWNKGVLAADRNTSIDKEIMSFIEETKIFKVNGYLFGFAGHTNLRDKLITWVVNGFKVEDKPELPIRDESFSFIVVDCIEKKVYNFVDNLTPNSYSYDTRLVIGSLSRLAKGALIMGCSADEAVKTALNAYKLRPEAKYKAVDVLVDDYVHDERNTSEILGNAISVVEQVVGKSKSSKKGNTNAS